MHRLTLTRACIVLGLAALVLASTPAEAATVTGRVVLRAGDTPTGEAAVTTIGPPFVNIAGDVAFSGEFADGDNYVLVGNDVIWVGSNDLVETLTAPEPAVDSNSEGHFVYAPDADGLDALYTDAGLLAVAGQAAVGHDAPAIYGFHIAPSMNEDGSVHWIAGIDLDADGDVDGRTFYRSSDGTSATIEALLSSGDMIPTAGTLDVTPGSIDNDYAFAKDGSHLIQLAEGDSNPATDEFVMVDGVLVLREGDNTPDGDAFENFDLVSINTNANYMLTGDTNGPVAADEFLAVNGTIEVREGGEVAGVTLGDPATLRFVAISDFDQAVYAWGYQGPFGFRETVFFACDANNLAATSQVVLTTVDDGLDIDDDGGTDFALGDLTFAIPTASRATAETQFVYVPLQLDDGFTSVDAMIEVPVTCCGNGAVNPFETCDDGNDDDTDACLSTCVAASCGDGFIWVDMEECDDGNLDDNDECPTTCVPASCGDGFVQTGVEECDDANDVDTDECTTTCNAAGCGDGFVQDGVEECDDGNTDDDEVCLGDCTLPEVGSTGGSSDGGSATSPDTSAGSVSDSASASASDTDGTGGIEGSASSVDSTGEDGSGGASDGGGCGCQTDTPARGHLAWMGLGVLGLARRRRSSTR